MTAVHTWAVSVTAAAAALAGCDAAPHPHSADARIVEVEACTRNDLELGRCVTDSGVPCTGAGNEIRAFEAMVAGDTLTAVLGPQGSKMFVLSARTTGIVPGDPADPTSADNPLMQIVVTSESNAEIARYLGRAGFADDGTALVVNGLFVVVTEGTPSGQPLIAHGTLTDAASHARCGTLAFIGR
jgi:hypothetical protein